MPKTTAIMPKFTVTKTYTFHKFKFAKVPKLTIIGIKLTRILKNCGNIAAGTGNFPFHI